MTISEKSAYLKGLMEGMNLASSDETKLFGAIVDLLGDMAQKVSAIEKTTIAISDELDEIEEDLDAIEDYILDEEDDFDDEFNVDFDELPDEGFDEIEEELEQEELQREKLRQEAYKKEKEKNGGKGSTKSGASASCGELGDASVPTVEELEKEFDALETSDYEYGGIED